MYRSVTYSPIRSFEQDKFLHTYATPPPPSDNFVSLLRPLFLILNDKAWAKKWS